MSESISMEYLAGFFDGEGSIGIARKTKGECNSFVLVAQCGQINPLILFYMQERWGGTVNKTHTQTGRTFYKWHIHAAQAFKFITDIQSYLLIKRAQADLAVEFYSVQSNAARLHKHMPPLKRRVLVGRRRRCYEQMKTLNARGVNADE